MAAINAWFVYKETISINISCHDFILNLFEELCAKYVTSKTSSLSNLTRDTEDKSTSSSRKHKQCQINRCKN